jgi:hypothetical protein
MQFACFENKRSDTAVLNSEEFDTAVSDTALQDTQQEDQDTGNSEDTAEPLDTDECEPIVYTPNPFISSVVSYNPGPGTGFGQDRYPDIIMGPPLGCGEGCGSLDVLSLGKGGNIIVSFDITIVDGEGPDLAVFENPFIGWPELATVSASINGTDWVSWPCAAIDEANNYPGCAGFNPVLTHPDNCIDATDPNVSGGDLFDLADIGLSEASFIRIQDTGLFGDGFDLDAIAIINGQSN